MNKLNIRDVEMAIEAAQFYVFPGTTVTVCCLRLKNGYNVVGESACLNLSDFNPDVGMTLAYDNAKERVWSLLGYVAKENDWGYNRSVNTLNVNGQRGIGDAAEFQGAYIDKSAGEAKCTR